MRALVWDGAAARVVERPEPACTAGMALVRVVRAGICNTDLELIKGYMDFRGVLGHEFTGTVEDGPAEWRGKRVVGEINFGCGGCTNCRRGLQRHCPTRRVMGIQNADGAFAEYVAVPVANLHAVPESVDDDIAVFTEPLAAAFEILEQIHVQPGTECVVLGDGKLGLLVAQVLFQAGAEVLAVGQHPDKLHIMRARGIATVLAADWNHRPAALVVEATGSAEGLAAAIAATRPRGTLVLKSTVAHPTRLTLAPLVINEITVVGSRCGSFAPALRALETGSIDVRSLIAARRPLQEAADALRLAATPGVLKVLLQP
ncbi:MAG TPA: alcohol dehydrogenase catalytic domain-containing protein [Candidatus Margulisiibacteriota bacterium]|nr:alcohol dehydrogenase catalytic domain-containing protein [Candidatus Margulisiibacteriota bacterium]